MSTALTLPSHPARRWQLPLGVLLALLLLVLWRYQATAVAMVDTWSRSESYTHAFVVPPIALWLIWRQRDLLRTLQPTPAPLMLGALVVLVALWTLGDMVAVNAASQFALVGLLVALVPAVLGWQVTGAVLFPLVFLFFAVPFGDFLTPWLMRMTADFTVGALRLTGIPVYREGQQFIIPSGHWSVVEACSGIRYLMASFMVGSLFAYLNFQSVRRRIVFVILSLVVPVLANWVRAYIIVMLGHLSNNRIATGVDHIVYGWVFFGIVILGLFYAGSRWAEHPVPASAPSAAGSRAEVVVAPHRWAVVAVLAAIVLQGPWWLQRTAPAGGVAVPPLVLPEALAAGWPQAPAIATTWRAAFASPTIELRQAYARSGATVGVHLALYRSSGGANRLISSSNVLVPAESHEWNLMAQGLRPVQVGAQTTTWRTHHIMSADDIGVLGRPRLTVWQLYWIGGRLMTSDVQAKLHQARLRLTGEPDDAVSLLLYAEERDGQRADALLQGFVVANFDILQRLLSQANAAR
ncbi:MAG: exosortase A [Burkholderiales bacterium PBB5]|nr:MAG: exosortase A [Burkholderiales bacterium PBB5]